MAFQDPASISIISDSVNNFLLAHPILVSIVMLWALIWKGFSMWKAAQNKSLPWFVILLVINSLGILDILYIFVFSKMNSSPSTNNFPKPSSKKGKKR
ncbi:MAG: DUF5652 family protein [Nanoarchaeota archaeon]